MKIITLDDPIIGFHNHPKALLDYAGSQGVNPEKILRDTDIPHGAVTDIQSRISYAQYKQLIQSCMEKLEDPVLGLHFGEKLGFHGHGLIGFAAMACQNIGEAIETAIRFKKAISPITNMELKQFHNQVSLVCMPAFEGGPSQRFFVEVLFASLMYSFRYNIKDMTLNFSFDFNYDEPENLHEYHRVLGEKCTFNVPQNRICCESKILDAPLRFSNPAIVNDAKLSTSSVVQQLNQQAGFLEAVRTYVKERLPEYPDIDELANHFNVSRSTLKRRLQAHNTSYKTIMDEMKMLTACELLESSRLSVDEISSHLYFSEGAAFRRAFKRCCGMSPSQYRKRSSLRLVG
ncbi:MAG: AraC family transcriptional regulator ligand-binding domain-containing protein [Ketobacteraceae bacterium]|nr:AraC family transcriptional regulator ligand-binding domain-containing protein [Ketobacteraceae bacterium]